MCVAWSELELCRIRLLGLNSRPSAVWQRCICIWETHTWIPCYLGTSWRSRSACSMHLNQCLQGQGAKILCCPPQKMYFRSWSQSAIITVHTWRRHLTLIVVEDVLSFVRVCSTWISQYYLPFFFLNLGIAQAKCQCSQNSVFSAWRMDTTPTGIFSVVNNNAVRQVSPRVLTM